MSTLNVQGASLYYELSGDPANPPVLLVAGLGGTSKSWSTQTGRFAKDHYVILPDHRGTGQSSRTLEGHTTKQLAADMAALIEHLGVGQVHVIGSSTGGAIAQYMALDHPNTVRTLTLASTFARFDAFMKREFEARRKMAAEWDRHSLLSAYALFLFSPRFTHDHPEKVTEWVERAGSHPAQPNDLEIALKRIDMIAAHDAFMRLGEIKKPSLVICGDHNFCTPLPGSEEIARALPGAELVVIQDAGELIEIEREAEFFQIVSSFITRYK